MLKVGPDRRPFRGDDRIDRGVAQGAVRHNKMIAQDTVELRAKAFDGSARLRVQAVGTELDRDAFQCLRSRVIGW